jgi:lipopolysaccharide transport protein LptA
MTLCLLYAEKIEITSNKFVADEKELITKFYGFVSIKKGENLLTSDEVIVKFNSKRKPLYYEANYNVNFKLKLKSGVYEGKADKLIYTPDTKIYRLIGDIEIKDKLNDKKIFAKEIKLSETSGKAEVFGDENEPVKFIFSIEDSK